VKGKEAGKGDRGATSLADGTRVSKSTARVAALGAVDELNAALGVVRTATMPESLRDLLASLQRDLLALGANLARPLTSAAGASAEKARWSEERVKCLDRLLAAGEARLAELRSFILPGGSPSAAALQWARTVCRRAERAVVALETEEALDPTALSYLNRLSDLLFALAREENQRQGVAEEIW
jgi:cob(I)alamin adenosyltransferase